MIVLIDPWWQGIWGPYKEGTHFSHSLLLSVESHRPTTQKVVSSHFTFKDGRPYQKRKCCLTEIGRGRDEDNYHQHWTRKSRISPTFCRPRKLWLTRTSCWYVPGRVVRMSSALLVGPFENKQMCHSSSRHPLYFIISRICLGCLDHTPFTMTKSLQDVLLVRPRTCSKDVLGHSWLNGGHSDNK